MPSPPRFDERLLLYRPSALRRTVSSRRSPAMRRSTTPPTTTTTVPSASLHSSSRPTSNALEDPRPSGRRRRGGQWRCRIPTPHPPHPRRYTGSRRLRVLSKSPCLDARGPTRGETVLMPAILTAASNLSVLSRHRPLLSRDRCGRTAVHLACTAFGGNAGPVRALGAVSMLLTAEDERVRTPLLMMEAESAGGGLANKAWREQQDFFVRPNSGPWDNDPPSLLCPLHHTASLSS
mmetsp:Transcript_22576/g.45713  ORF Transcript_22576/g.45713 Transcript_22576/m.45713 type:complete len:235 (-) Transcript_22576:83-787(-)